MSDLASLVYEDAPQLLTGSDPYECYKCGQAKKGLEGCHLDANSYFKNVTAKRVMAAARYFVELARREGHDTITLLRARKFKGFLGGTADCQNRDRVIIRLGEMLEFLEWELHHNIGHLGDLLIQLNFPPMGGRA